jgi:hypothetical protein
MTGVCSSAIRGLTVQPTSPPAEERLIVRKRRLLNHAEIFDTPVRPNSEERWSLS